MEDFSNQQKNNQFNQNSLAPQKGLFSLPPAVMQFVPWIPLILEATTGQKIPQMSGSIAEIQQTLGQIQMSQVRIIQQQQSLEQRLTNLETQAGQQFTHLGQQVQSIKSIRLTHDRERKQIDYLENENN